MEFSKNKVKIGSKWKLNKYKTFKKGISKNIGINHYMFVAGNNVKILIYYNVCAIDKLKIGQDGGVDLFNTFFRIIYRLKLREIMPLFN